MTRLGTARGRILVPALAGVLCMLPWAEAGKVGEPAPELSNQVWINSAPLHLADLRGRVVLLEFWTYG